MTFQKITILPNDRSTWRIYTGFQIIPGVALGLFKWKYDGETSNDMSLWDAIQAANNYAEEVELIGRINSRPTTRTNNDAELNR